ncbi:hypothetical protein PO124_28340 [Bacillus licheniformis]|nr:hypothetical protein [Bacillus licheniformis]
MAHQARGAFSDRNLCQSREVVLPGLLFLRKDYRIFRCDRIKRAELDEHKAPIDLSGLNLKNRFRLCPGQGRHWNYPPS